MQIGITIPICFKPLFSNLCYYDVPMCFVVVIALRTDIWRLAFDLEELVAVEGITGRDPTGGCFVCVYPGPNLGVKPFNWFQDVRYTVQYDLFIDNCIDNTVVGD